MALDLTTLETELKNRARVLGVFAASDSTNRMRYAIRKAAFKVWLRQDWDFKNSTATITTSSGNLGPYTAPSGLVRFATTQKVSEFGFEDKERLVPIYSTNTNSWKPYIRVVGGSIYFFEDPGTGSLTLNYLAQVSNSIESATLDAFLDLFDNGLNDAVIDGAFADILGDLPGKLEESRERMKHALFSADEYWEEVTRDRYQKTISPKGINGVSVDFSARVITVLGVLAQRFPDPV